MSPLLKLLFLRTKASLRRLFRVQGNPKKLLLLIVGLAAVSLWLGSILLSAAVHRPTASNFVQDYAPLVLAVFTLSSLLIPSGDHAIAFLPAEVDLLFPAPFTRRQLLGYKLLSGMLATLFGALVFSIALVRQTASWPAAFIGVLLAFWFIQFLATGLSLAKQIIGELSYTRARRTAIGLVILALAIILLLAAPGQSLENFPALLRQFNDSTTGTILLAPFRVFTRVMGSHSGADLLGHVAIALPLDVLTALLVLRLDADYLEASIRASERFAERLKRARSGNPFAPAPGKAARSRQLHASLWLGGAVPIAWRQLATIIRGGKRWLVRTVFLLAIASFFLYSLRRAGAEHPGMALGFSAGVLLYMTMVFTFFLRFDFRSDLEHFETLKTLPISPRAIALGELLCPMLLLLTLQALFIAGATLAFNWPLDLVLASVAALPIINLFLLAIENLLFLLFPVRFANRGIADFSLMGRHMLLMLGKMLIYAVIGALAAGAALGVHALTDSQVGAFAAGWAILAIAGACTLLGVARAFRAFDVSADMPA